MQKPGLVVLGVVLVVAGCVFTLQGLGYLAGSAMTGVTLWAVVGPVLALVGVVLLVRAFALFYPGFWLPEHTRAFQIVSSLIVLALGLSFLFGTIRAWPVLSMRS